MRFLVRWLSSMFMVCLLYQVSSSYLLLVFDVYTYIYISLLVHVLSICFVV